jgi:hypothetical protein
MPRYKVTPEISGLTAPDGTSYWADADGTFEIPGNATQYFLDHGIQLSVTFPLQDEALFPPRIEHDEPLMIGPDDAEMALRDAVEAFGKIDPKLMVEPEAPKRRGRPPKIKAETPDA